MNDTPAIVVLAYRRAAALGRLLRSLASAVYEIRPTLVISVEYGASSEVLELVENFHIDGLEKVVIKNNKKLGLREHVLKCGDLTALYGSIILLEDDLVVDKYFYQYALNAINFYKDENRVAGIGLYSYGRNEWANLPFCPMRNGYSAYFMQVPCSWGQCWTYEQWISFKEWYQGKDEDQVKGNILLPDSVRSWPESSWKKYFFSYMVERNKYFLYPYDSYTTNCSDAGGEHIIGGTIFHQVALSYQKRGPDLFHFCLFDDNVISYDAFMEPDGDYIYELLGFEKKDVVIDFQGTKSVELIENSKYVVSPFRVGKLIKQFNASFRPIEHVVLESGFQVDSKYSWYLCATFNYRKPSKIDFYRKYIDIVSYYTGVELSYNRIFACSLVFLWKKVMSKLSFWS